MCVNTNERPTDFLERHIAHHQHTARTMHNKRQEAVEECWEFAGRTYYQTR
jgi:hypothetical protein